LTISEFAAQRLTALTLGSAARSGVLTISSTCIALEHHGA
jgi:hypothetical protein